LRPNDIKTVEELSEKNFTIYGEEKTIKIVNEVGFFEKLVSQYLEKFVTKLTIIITNSFFLSV
jgi:hypothetical protein